MYIIDTILCTINSLTIRKAHALYALYINILCFWPRPTDKVFYLNLVPNFTDYNLDETTLNVFEPSDP